MFNELTINQIGGLFNQMYNLEEELSDKKPTDGFFDINSLFWYKFYDINNIKNSISELCKRSTISSTKLEAVKNAPEVFIDILSCAINNIRSKKLDEKAFFSALETLQIFCNVHTFLYSSPFELSIFDGYRHNQFSSEQLKKNCLLPFCNPYYSFVVKHVMPNIECSKLDVLWIKGRPNITGFCIARIVKEKNPKVKVISISNNTEFFSFNKITSVLKNNKDLFSVFDCIVLDDNINTYDKVRKHLKDNKSLFDINNIIYTPDKGETIICTNKKDCFAGCISVSKKEIEFNKTINLKLFPNCSCYWNKCTFCAINQKYCDTNNKWDTTNAVNQLRTILNLGLDKFWALDEAVPINIIEKICELIQSNNLEFTWHIRTRIEKDILLNNLPAKLAESGLKHILFGFESASHRVLKLMNKTTDIDSYVELSEKIVRAFNDLKVFVHFPLIIGYPTESQKDRNETFRFMDYLKNKYPYFSYNVNVLNLDVASQIYKNWGEFNISSIEYPCEPHKFIGNGVSWKCNNNPIEITELENQADKQMRLQYSWYPQNTLIDVNSFFAMWEYSRSQMDVIMDLHNNIKLSSFDIKQKFIVSPHVTLFLDDNNMFCLYNFDNHQCIRGGKLIYDVINEVKNKGYLDDYFKKYKQTFSDSIYKFILDLINNDFIQFV